MLATVLLLKTRTAAKNRVATVTIVTVRMKASCRGDIPTAQIIVPIAQRDCELAHTRKISVAGGMGDVGRAAAETNFNSSFRGLARVIDLVLMRRRSGEEAMVYVLNIFAALEFLAGLFFVVFGPGFFGTLAISLSVLTAGLASIVCTENPIRIDWGRESPNVSAQ